MSHNNDSVRDKLIEITNQGLMLKSIALSRFKGGMDCLKESDVEVLCEYLKEVHIPQWKTVIKGKMPITMRERLLASRNKQNEEKPKRRRSNVSLDLLNELES